MKKHKKLLILYILLLAIVLVWMASLWHQKSPQSLSNRDYAEIHKEGVLRVITEYSPTGYFIEGDTIRGFQYELCQAIAEISGLEVQLLLEMNLEKSFIALESQEVDVIARNIPITAENKTDFLFTEPILLNKQVLVQRTEKANEGIKPIRNQLLLGGMTLYVPKDSPALLRIRNLEHEIGDTIYVIENDLYSDEQLIAMVANRDIDFAVCDQQNAEQMHKQYPEIDIQTDISFTQLQSWATRRNSPALRDSLNVWLKELKERGIYSDIYHRYYKKRL